MSFRQTSTAYPTTEMSYNTDVLAVNSITRKELRRRIKKINESRRVWLQVVRSKCEGKTVFGRDALNLILDYTPSPEEVFVRDRVLGTIGAGVVCYFAQGCNAQYDESVIGYGIPLCGKEYSWCFGSAFSILNFITKAFCKWRGVDRWAALRELIQTVNSRQFHMVIFEDYVCFERGHMPSVIIESERIELPIGLHILGEDNGDIKLSWALDSARLDGRQL